MATSADDLIMGLLRTAGLGSTPNSVAAQNVALQGGQLQNAAAKFQLEQAQQQQTQQQQFQQAMQSLGSDPSDANFAALIRKYPDQIDAARKLKAAMDEPARQSHITYFDGLRRVAGDGKPALVTQNLQQMIAAEKAAGHDTSEAEDMLAQVQAGDPAAMRRVEAFAKGQLALLDPTYYAALQKGDGAFTLGEHQQRYDANGNLIASGPNPADWVWDSEGGNWVRRPGTGDAVTGGGGQASGVTGAAPNSTSPVPRTAAARVAQLGDIWSSIAPGTAPTSGIRTPQEQAALRARGVTFTTNSAHTSGNAIDVPIVPGQTAQSIRDAYAQRGVSVRVIQESGHGPGQGTGPHFHIQRIAGQPAAAAPQAQASNPNIIHVRDPRPPQAPSGYRWKGSNLEPIPGGPADSIALSPDAITSMASQYLAGDKTVMQGLGRGQQGSANIARVRAEIAKQAHDMGLTGRDIAARMADFAGVVSGERAAGTRIAQVELAATEAERIIPLALQASDALPRSGFVPFAKAEQMVRSGTNDPRLRRFVTANTALVNVYSRAISPTGAPTVSDKEHARELLSTAYDQESYRAVVDQMRKEIAAARAAPRDVRGSLYGNVGGMGGRTAPSRGWGHAQVVR